ncbi:MAG: hypothetical protein U5K79_17285 [Cyclobacteriaceae bacterium]|nr:hypothetical protein [Cyclobacteriaceae bacterium]
MAGQHGRTLHRKIQHGASNIIILKRHKLAGVLGYSVIHAVHNSVSGKEQYEIVPTFGIDYEYWLSHKWAIGTYNEFAFINIEVEKNEEEYLKRENVRLFSGVVVFEPISRLSVFVGTGVETDPHHTLMVAYMGTEYAFIRSDNWEVSIGAGYIYKEFYDAFTFGVVIGRRFGKAIPSKHHE